MLVRIPIPPPLLAQNFAKRPLCQLLLFQLLTVDGGQKSLMRGNLPIPNAETLVGEGQPLARFQSK